MEQEVHVHVVFILVVRLTLAGMAPTEWPKCYFQWAKR